MSLYECDCCGGLQKDPVCDRCHSIIAQEWEDLQEEASRERHYLSEYTARAELGLQLDSQV